MFQIIFFSLALFGFYGDITVELYESEIAKMKSLLKVRDPSYEEDNNSYYEKFKQKI